MGYQNDCFWSEIWRCATDIAVNTRVLYTGCKIVPNFLVWWFYWQLEENDVMDGSRTLLSDRRKRSEGRTHQRTKYVPQKIFHNFSRQIRPAAIDVVRRLHSETTNLLLNILHSIIIKLAQSSSWWWAVGSTRTLDFSLSFWGKSNTCRSWQS